MIKTKDLILAGHIGIDSGQAMVGDPCYIDNWDTNKNDEWNIEGKVGQYSYHGASATTLENGYGALDIGKAAMRLGAGRETKEDKVLLDVGLDLHKKIGSYVKKGESIATLYVQDKGIEEARQLILDALTIGKEQKHIVLIKQTIK